MRQDRASCPVLPQDVHLVVFDTLATKSSAGSSSSSTVWTEPFVFNGLFLASKLVAHGPLPRSSYHFCAYAMAMGCWAGSIRWLAHSFSLRSGSTHWNINCCQLRLRWHSSVKKLSTHRISINNSSKRSIYVAMSSYLRLSKLLISAFMSAQVLGLWNRSLRMFINSIMPLAVG